MNKKYALSIVLAFVLLSSCGAIKKTMHPERYCAERNCHKEHAENSIYCNFHYTIKMYEIIGAAEKVKMKDKSEEQEDLKKP